MALVAGAPPGVPHLGQIKSQHLPIHISEEKKLIFYFNLAAILDLPYSAISQSVLGRFASNSKSKLISRFFCFINTLPPPLPKKKCINP